MFNIIVYHKADLKSNKNQIVFKTGLCDFSSAWTEFQIHFEPLNTEHSSLYKPADDRLLDTRSVIVSFFHQQKTHQLAS